MLDFLRLAGQVVQTMSDGRVTVLSAVRSNSATPVACLESRTHLQAGAPSIHVTPNSDGIPSIASHCPISIIYSHCRIKLLPSQHPMT